MVSTVQRLALFSFVMILLSAGALAAVNCEPPLNGDWTFNATNSTLVCDNGTAVVLNGSLILLDNASVTFTNWTNLSATSVQVSNSSSALLFANTSFMNATLSMSAGNATFQDGASFNQTPLLTGGALNLSNTTVAFPSLSLNGSALLFSTASNLDLDGNLVLGAGTSASFLNGSVLNATVVQVSDNSSALLFVDGSVLNATLDLSGGNATFQDGATFSLPASISGGLLFTSNTSIYIAGNISLSGTASFILNRTTFTISSPSFGVFLNNSAELLLDNNSFLNNTHVYVYNGTFIYKNTNIPSYINEGHVRSPDMTSEPTITVSNVTDDNGLLDFDIEAGGVNLITDSSASNLTVMGTASVSVINSTFRSLIQASSNQITLSGSTINESFSQFGGALKFLNDNTVSSGVVTFGLIPSSFTIDGNVTFGSPSLEFSNGSLTRVYPLFISYSDGSPLANASIKVLSNVNDLSSAVWSGTTDAAGYAEPNVTFNSTNYNDTLYLFVNASGARQYLSLALLSGTPLNWTLQPTPVISLVATSGSIAAGSFGFNVSFSEDAVNASYAITNATGAVWVAGSWNQTQLSAASWAFSQSYDGLFLPAGTWTLNVTASNGSVVRSSVANLISIPAIRTTLVSASSQSATIGGSAIGFTFNVTTKGAGSKVGAFVTLTDGSNVYDSSYAQLVQGNVSVNVSGSSLYTGAGNVTLAAINATPPSYVLLNLTADGTIRNGQLTLSLTPYSGLVAGTYGGTYGFGVFG